MSIANLENVVSNAERRALLRNEARAVPRVSDLASATASSRGKLELTMSDEEGTDDKLIQRIVDEAVKNIFTHHLDAREFRAAVGYFESGQSVEVGDSLSSKQILDRIAKVPGLRKRAEELAEKFLPDLQDQSSKEAATASVAEFILEGLHVNNKLNKAAKGGETSYRR
jgi:magnesium chelatase subunit I